MQRLVISSVLRLGPALHPRGPRHPLRQLRGLPRRVGAFVTDEVDYNAPDHCTVGVIGEVGNRLFLFYCRQALTETTVKVEKQQVAVLGRATWAGSSRSWVAPATYPMT